MESEQFHTCTFMAALPDPKPYFYPYDALDTSTSEKIKIVMMAVAGQFSYVSIQVDYCPWCGQVLTPFTRERSLKFSNELAAYGEYRKRWVKQGATQKPPLCFREWQQIANEFDETEFLLRHAKPEHRDSLFRRKQTLRDRLALGVVLPITPAEEGEVSEVTE